MRVWYLTRDLGDGSSTVDFFRNQPSDELMDDESYYANEGCASFFDIPDGPNTIRFRD